MNEEKDFISIKVEEDNLMYLFFDDGTAFSVDSLNPHTIIHALSCTFDKRDYSEEEVLALAPGHKKRNLKYALTTHWHADHSGGDSKLKDLSPNTIFLNSVSAEDLKITDIGHFKVQALKTPCHTLDSACFYVTREERKYLLTGDFLFKLGCGRFFEGSPQMFISSLEKLKKHVDDSTLLLYGHDYYETNKRFAEKFYAIDGCEDFFLTFETEKKLNPFINFRACRDGEPLSDTELLKRIRTMKDEFK